MTKTFDIMTLEAAEMFSVEPEEVTFAQRAYAKHYLYPLVYGPDAMNELRRLHEKHGLPWSTGEKK